jgi:methyl coenzyme M reductase gamma subunit
MEPQADGRTFACRYCGSKIQVAIDGEQIARGMQVDLANLEDFVAKLATALSQGFAEHSTIEARGRVVHAISLALDPDHFVLHREGSEFVTRHKKVVRGVALKTAVLPLDQWFQKLTDALARHANQNARAAWVLSQLGGPR